MPPVVRFVTVGSLKEPYLREAVAEYRKRLSGLCRVEELELKEARLPDRPSEAEIRAAIPPRSYPVALCVEGERLSSPALTARLQDACRSAGSLCFIIGSSFGLDSSVKSAARLRLSVSDLTFPHQLMRVILYEAVYRCFQIDLGTRYHK